MFEAIRWPDHMKPSRNPIHFTNELEADVSPKAIWSTLTDVALWPAFYPNVSEVRLLDGASALELGTRFQAGLAGLDVIASVEEFEPFERIAWYGGPKDHPEATAYHAFIFTRSDGSIKSCDKRGGTRRSPWMKSDGGRRAIPIPPSRRWNGYTRR